MGLHEDRVFQDILLCRNILPVGLEALKVSLDGFPGHLDGLFDGVAVRDATWQGRDYGGISPFRFLPEQDSVADLFHGESPS